MHILLIIGYLSKRYDFCKAPALFSIWYIDYPFITTFLLSFLSATSGVANFVKAGPAGIIRNDKWCMGFGTPTYLLLFLNIAATISARGLVVAAYVDLVRLADPAYLLLILLCFLPQFIHVSYFDLNSDCFFSQKLVQGDLIGCRTGNGGKLSNS